MGRRRKKKGGNLPAPVTSATLPSREAEARPRGPGMALYLPFFPVAGAAALSSMECLPLLASVVVEATGTWKVSSVKPGAILKQGVVVGNRQCACWM